MSLTFHRTFSLSRSSIAKIIRVGLTEPGFKQSDLGRKTDLGTIYQEAMPRYALRAGLLDKKNRLTTFGRFATQYDPELEKTSTQWVLHYHLAAPHGATTFWYYLVRKHFLPGDTFSAYDLITDLTKFLKENTENIPAPRSLRSTVTVFTGTYLKPDGLGKLGLLKETNKGTYHIPATQPPPVWVIGYALTDYWDTHFPGRLTVDMESITQGEFAAIFLLGEDRLTELLLQLKQEGMLDLYRISRPYQVVLLQPSPQFALQKMYEI